VVSAFVEPFSFQLSADSGLQVKTLRHDKRFPSTNQSRHCYTKYNEYYKYDLADPFAFLASSCCQQFLQVEDLIISGAYC
jgi:hypothetical protein